MSWCFLGKHFATRVIFLRIDSQFELQKPELCPPERAAGGISNRLQADSMFYPWQNFPPRQDKKPVG